MLNGLTLYLLSVFFFRLKPQGENKQSAEVTFGPDDLLPWILQITISWIRNLHCGK